MIEKKKRKKRITDQSIYDFRINNNIEYKRRKGDNNWRRVCKINNCFSIAKGKNRLCITHGGGYICRIKNCENTSRHSFNYCDIHKHLYLCKKNNENKMNLFMKAKETAHKTNAEEFTYKNKKGIIKTYKRFITESGLIAYKEKKMIKNPLDKYDNIGKKFVKDFFNFNLLQNKNKNINYNPINLSF